MAVLINSSGDATRRIAATPSATSFTVTGWGYWNNNSGDQVMLTLSDSGGSNYEAFFCTGGALYVYSASYSGFSANPGTGQWFRWAISGTSVSSSSLKGYWGYPGGTTYTAQTQGYNVSVYALALANDVYSGYEWYGRMAGVKVFNTVLSQNQIEQEWSRYVPVNWNSCISWYPMLPGSTERTIDYMRNVNLTEAGTVTDESGPPLSWGTSRGGLIYPISAGGGALSHELEGFRFRDDDGNEAGATWAQLQDTNHTITVDGTTRLRLVVQGPTGGQYQLEWAEDGTENWNKVVLP